MNQLLESFYAWYRSGLRNPKYRWLLIFGTLTYILSPIDVSPDVIPLLGWIDDGILITLLVTEVSQLMMDIFRGAGPVDSAKSGSTIEEDDDGVVVDVKAQEIP